jgi:hypothetical protein
LEEADEEVVEVLEVLETTPLIQHERRRRSSLAVFT